MKVKPIACLLALGLLLSGCGGQGGGAAQTYDPASTAQALLDAQVFDQELEALDADMAVPYLGLSAEPEQAVVYTSLSGGYEELVVLQLADESAAATALEELSTHLQDRLESERQVQYKPEDRPKLKQALAEQAGNTVLLLVCADYDAARETLDGLAS